jgi:hypothetical protein
VFKDLARVLRALKVLKGLPVLRDIKVFKILQVRRDLKV